MSVSQLLSSIQTLSGVLENASAVAEEILYNCEHSADNLTIEHIGEILEHGKGLNIDGTVTIKDYLAMATKEYEIIEEILE